MNLELRLAHAKKRTRYWIDKYKTLKEENDKLHEEVERLQKKVDHAAWQERCMYREGLGG